MACRTNYRRRVQASNQETFLVQHGLLSNYFLGQSITNGPQNACADPSQNSSTPGRGDWPDGLNITTTSTTDKLSGRYFPVVTAWVRTGYLRSTFS